MFSTFRIEINLPLQRRSYCRYQLD